MMMEPAVSTFGFSAKSPFYMMPPSPFYGESLFASHADFSFDSVLRDPYPRDPCLRNPYYGKRQLTDNDLLIDLFSSTPSQVIEPILHDMLETKARSLVPLSESTHEQLKDASQLPTLSDFVRALSFAAKTLPVTLISAFIYLERLANRLSAMALGHFETAYRVLVASIVLAAKYIEDEALRNISMTSVLAPWFTLKEINRMERQFLKCIDYNITVHPDNICSVIRQHDQLLFFIYFGSATLPELDVVSAAKCALTDGPPSLGIIASSVC